MTIIHNIELTMEEAKRLVEVADAVKSGFGFDIESIRKKIEQADVVETP